ncbi:MAG: hypothetical protein M3Y87_12635 [Myxococcota bacterium]|nr:hypothetical protein [Myxococcota bacterium]
MFIRAAWMIGVGLVVASWAADAAAQQRAAIVVEVAPEHEAAVLTATRTALAASGIEIVPEGELNAARLMVLGDAAAPLDEAGGDRASDGRGRAGRIVGRAAHDRRAARAAGGGRAARRDFAAVGGELTTAETVVQVVSEGAPHEVTLTSGTEAWTCAAAPCQLRVPAGGLCSCSAWSP